MLDVKSLKPGNIISFKGITNMVVEDVTLGTINIKDNEGIFPHDVFDPVKLREPWLLAFNFVMTGDGSFDRERDEFRVTCEYEIRYKGKIICEAPEFVHEFQNLFHKHTGKQLLLDINTKELRKLK
jgi:hypothetical protein